MAVKSATLNASLFHHITAVRPPSSSPQPHQCERLPTSKFYFSRAYASSSNSGRGGKEEPPDNSRWRFIKDGLKNRTSQAYQQFFNVKELGRMVSWYVPGISPSQTIQAHRITLVQPVVKSQESSSPALLKNSSLENMRKVSGVNGSGTKHARPVRLKPSLKREKGKVRGPKETRTCQHIEANHKDGVNVRTNVTTSSDPSESKIDESAASSMVLHSQETEKPPSEGTTSGFMYGIFDMDVMRGRIQRQLQNLESLRSFGVTEEKKTDLTETESTRRNKVMQYSEEFETGSQGDVYGDVIIQFREKTDGSDTSSSPSGNQVPEKQDPSVSQIFREDLDEWSRNRYQKLAENDSGLSKSDPREDISQKVSSTFITESIQRFNRKFVRDQTKPSKDLSDGTASQTNQKEETATSYFDTGSPLIDMTEVMGEASDISSRILHDLVGSEKQSEVHQRDAEDRENVEGVFQERKPKVQITQSSIRARARSLAAAVSKPSSMSSKLMNLQRLCTHLSEYQETRDIAVEENLIPILLRLREGASTALQGEIRRALALMGYADPVKQKGIRILSVDGGGSRGVIPIEILRRLEESCGQRIGDMFDYIIGVSSGAVSGFLLAIPKVELDECERLYRDMSVQVFGQNRLAGTRNLVMRHSYYDTEGWMDLLKNHLHGKGAMGISETARDATCPKVASVATIMNVGTLRDYLFRNYNLPPCTRSFYEGSSKYRLWEALRASSAAPGYFEEFKLDDHVFQDGGVLTNNPCALAVHECRLLWPDTPIQCVVSVGTGRFGPPGQEFPAEYSSLKTKLFKVLCSATDTEAVHTILKDLLPNGTYFRFNPLLSEDFLLDENRPEKLTKMQEEARHYLNRNELKLIQATGVLTREKSTLDRINDWVTLKKKMRIPPRKTQRKLS